MREYKKFRLTIRMIEALAFDPVEDTIETLPFSFSLSLALSLSLWICNGTSAGDFRLYSILDKISVDFFTF